MQSFQHTPLQGRRTIRLLRLEPTSSLDAPVECTLQEVSLDSNPRYDAISYAWDGQESDQEVLCSGRPLLVTLNAQLVLRYTREPRQPRWVWIDSICINQKDDAEKTGQVRMMREIYSKATEVLLWLGESTKTSASILRSISNKAKLETQRRNRKQFDINEAVFTSPLFHDLLVTVILKPVLACIGLFGANKNMLQSANDQHSQFISHAVFERIWCVQEIALGPSVRVVCGKKSVSLDELDFHLESQEKLMRTLDSSVKFKVHKDRLAIHHDLRAAIHAARYPQAGIPPQWPPLSVILDSARKKGATNPKDKIIGLAGVFNFMNVNISPPDYATPTWQIYREATVAAIQYDHNLDIIYQITGLNQTESLPSWVPDYGNSSSPSQPAYEFANASGNSQPRWRFDLANGDLCISGLVIDSISQRIAPLPFEPTNDSIIVETKTNAISPSTLQVFQAVAITALQLKTYPTRESPTEALARTLCTPAVQRSNFAINDFTKVFSKWLELINGQDPAASLEEGMAGTPSRYLYESSHKSPEQRTYARELLAASLGSSIGILTTAMDKRVRFLHYWMYLQCVQKSLFVTRNGYLGIGPHSVGVGDLVVLFSGLKVPFVVRKVGTKWNLLAPVHVHGIMQGEWWDEKKAVEEFQLA